MEIKTKMRLSSIEQKVGNDGSYYHIARFLDEEDNKYQFYINEDYYNELSKHKKYDEVNLTLRLFESKNGRYGLGVV